MMYPKQKRRKKRKEHKPSILHQKDGTCYLCIKLRKDYRIHPAVHEHHIFGGPNRQISEAKGLKVFFAWNTISGGTRRYITIMRSCASCSRTDREPMNVHTPERSSWR